jgi:hypothetical protein
MAIDKQIMKLSKLKRTHNSSNLISHLMGEGSIQQNSPKVIDKPTSIILPSINIEKNTKFSTIESMMHPMAKNKNIFEKDFTYDKCDGLYSHFKMLKHKIGHSNNGDISYRHSNTRLMKPGEPEPTLRSSGGYQSGRIAARQLAEEVRRQTREPKVCWRCYCRRRYRCSMRSGQQ